MATFTFAGSADVFVISHEEFTYWGYERIFREHHLIERLPEGSQFHLLPLDLLQTYELDTFRSGGDATQSNAAVFTFDPQHDIFEHIRGSQQERYHLSIIGESHLYVAQKHEWFVAQAKDDFQF